jgi:hypothetical protein
VLIKSILQLTTIALLRRWLWVRAPPNPKISFDFENPQSRSGSHSAGGGAQFFDHVHTIVCCSLLLFFWVTLADLTLLTDVWCTSRYFMTLLAQFKELSSSERTVSRRSSHSTRHGSSVCSRERRSRWQSIHEKPQTSQGKKFLNNELRTVVCIDEGKIIFDQGEIVRNRAALHLD